MANLNVERLRECPPKNPNLLVKYTEMGNITEIQYMSHRNNKQTIQMLPGGQQYLVCASGEIKDCVKHVTRADQKKNLYKTFGKLRSIINANITDVRQVRWCTLTYAENMRDTKRLYVDFKKFNMRFKYHCDKNALGTYEYIVVAEPQRRGAWHLHVLLIFHDVAPFIANQVFREIWHHGFVQIKKLDNVDNVGAYLTAYLGDMELSECKASDLFNAEIKEVECTDDKGNLQKKRIVKGGRLSLYPADFNIYRCSRGINRPVSEMVTQKEATSLVSNSALTYEKTLKLTDTDNDYESIINTQYYNRLRSR